MKNKNKVTLEIAIPALNEEQNIESFVLTLLAQKQTNFSLEKITVLSDASTDKTDEIVEHLSITNPIIHLVRNTERKGKYHRMSQAFQNTTCDVLVVFDADIKITDDTFLEKMVEVLNKDDRAVMVAGHNVLIRPKGFIAKLVHSAFNVWDLIRFSIPDYASGTNFYGTATAFRGSFARSINIPNTILDPHLYIYLSADKVHGFRYCREAEVFQWPITTIGDYIKLLTRTLGKEDTELEKTFNTSAAEVYKIPFNCKVKGFITALKWDPIFAVLGFSLSMVMKIVPLIKKDNDQKWKMLNSTKKAFDVDKKRKLIISTYDDIKNPTYGGGGAIAIHELAKRLNNAFNITIVSWDHSGVKNEIIDTVHYKRIGNKYISPKLGMVLFQLALPMLVKRLDFDIWLESFGPPATTAFLPLFTKKKVIGIAHMLAAKDMQRKYLVNPSIIEKLGIKQYKYIVATNELLKTELQSINPKCECVVIPNGIEKIDETQVQKQKQILFVGRIEVNQKGLDLLLEAFKKFNTLQNNEYKLVIAGGGAESEIVKLKTLVSKKDLSQFVTLVGKSDASQKNKLMKESVAMAITSRFETFSMVTLEALANGLPVVCFDIDGLKWATSKIVLKAPAFDTTLFADNLNTVVANQETTNQRIAQGLDFAKAYTWDAVASSYREYLERL